VRALLRLLLLGLLVAFLVHAVRRALAAGREQRARRSRPGEPERDDAEDRGGSLPPDRLVCGACGHEFNPEQSGWICPKCGK
jgi:rubrerythrin